MFITYLLSKIRQHLRYRETVIELSQLSDRELDDIGISRGDIHYVASKVVAA